ncbi:MAG: peptidylprolyl isomerase [Acidimicrobiales bacterium]
MSDLFSEAVTYAAIRPAVLDALLADIDLTAEARTIYDDGIASGEITEQICLDAVVKAPDSFLEGGQPTPAEIAASRADMEAVRTELVAGGDFAAAAAQSDDPQVAEQQGDIGCVAPEQLEQNPQVAEAALTTEVGEISEVIDLDGGFLVLRVRSRGVPTFEDLQDAIEQNLQSQLPDTKLAEALQAEARTASVEVDPLFGRWDAEQGQVLTPEGPRGRRSRSARSARTRSWSRRRCPPS